MSQLKASLLLILGLTSVFLFGQVDRPFPDSSAFVILDKLAKDLTFTEALDYSKAAQERGALDTATAYISIGLNVAIEQKDDDLLKEGFVLLMQQYDLQGKHSQIKETADYLINIVDATLPKVKITYGSIYAALRLQQIDEVNRLFETVEPYLSDVDEETLGEYYSYKGIYELTSTRNLVQALDYFLLAKEYLKNNLRSVSRINNNLAGIYHTIQDLENCVALLDENIVIAREQNDLLTEMMTHYNLGIILNETEDYQGLLTNGWSALDISRRKGITHSIALAHTSIGQGHLGLGQLDSALIYFNTSIEKAQQEDNPRLAVGAHAGLMELYLQRGDSEKARYHGDAVKEYGGFYDYDIARPLATIYANLGEVDEAYSIMEEGYDGLKTKSEDRSNVELIKKFVEARKDEVLQSKEREYDAKLRQQRNRNRLLLFSVLAFFLGIIILLLLSSRNRLKKSNNSLTESNEALRQFAYIASHDLKEPIRNITSFSELLSRRFGDSQTSEIELREYLQFITSNAGVLQEIVKSLKVFINASFGELERETVKLDEVFAIVREHSQALVTENNGQLTFTIADEVNTLVYSKSLLILVLQNLIFNGFKYNDSEQPRVNVTVSKVASNSAQLQFAIKDNGVGIAPKYQQVIFTPFKTLQNKSVTQSSGLGLSICKTIIERYGGEILVSSDGSNGTVFTFTA